MSPVFVLVSWLPLSFVWACITGAMIRAGQGQQRGEQ